MQDADLCYTPAVELARMIRAKAISPVEVMDAVLDRAEALNPSLNAICTWTADAARSAGARGRAGGDAR